MRWLWIVAVVGLPACGVKMQERGSGVDPYAPVQHGYSCATSSSNQAPMVTAFPRGATDSPFPFVAAVPPGAESERLPLVLYFHDYTEQGAGIDGPVMVSELSRHGPLKRIQEGRYFRSIVLAPQATEWWEVTRLQQFLSWAMVNYPVDPTRVYITGNGAGGAAVWALVKVAYSRVAAAVPIAGGDAASAQPIAEEMWALKNVPHLSVHNFSDNIMGWGNSQSFGNALAYSFLVKSRLHGSGSENASQTYQLDISGREWKVEPGVALRDANGSFQNRPYLYVFQSGMGASSGPRVVPEHDAWTSTYQNEEVWNWMFCQKKENAR